MIDKTIRNMIGTKRILFLASRELPILTIIRVYSVKSLTGELPQSKISQSSGIRENATIGLLLWKFYHHKVSCFGS